MIRIALVLACLVAAEHRAHAIAACGNGEGWSLAPGATLPVHPRLVYYVDLRMQASQSGASIKATIDGASVPAKLTFRKASPYELAVVEVESDKPGKLVLEWGKATAAASFWHGANATYTLAKRTLPAVANATTSRFHRAYHHTSVHESDDGLAVRVDVPAIAFTARWRRDDKQDWQTLELTAVTIDGHQVARLGELGCSSNFTVAILEQGIDLELDALLPDGSTRKVRGLPRHVVLPPLPKDAPRSSP